MAAGERERERELGGELLDRARPRAGGGMQGMIWTRAIMCQCPTAPSEAERGRGRGRVGARARIGLEINATVRGRGIPVLEI